MISSCKPLDVRCLSSLDVVKARTSKVAAGKGSFNSPDRCILKKSFTNLLDCPSPSIKPLQDSNRGDFTYFNRLILGPKHHYKCLTKSQSS